MDKYRVKLNSSLEFTEEEIDIYTMVADLSKKRKLTSTIMGLIRLYYGNPGRFDGLDVEKYTDENRQAYLSTLKVSQTQYEREVNRKLNYLGSKVLTLESELKKLYSLAESGKLLGLGQRAEVTYCASIQLKSALRGLSAELKCPIDMESATDLEAECEDIMAYIIEHYDGAINELKQMLQAVGGVAQAPVVMQYPQQVQQTTTEQAATQIQQIPTQITNTPKELEAQGTEQVLGNEQKADLPSEEALAEFENMFGINFSF